MFLKNYAKDLKRFNFLTGKKLKVTLNQKESQATYSSLNH